GTCSSDVLPGLYGRLPPSHMFSESPLCSPPQCIFDPLACRLAQLCVPELLAGDQPAVNSLPQRLTYKRPLDRAGLYQVKNRSQRPSVFVARSDLYFALEQVTIMEHDNARDIAVTPEVRRNGQMELGRVQIRQLIEAQRRLITVNPFYLFLPIPGPERPKYKIGPIRRREQRQAVDAAVFPDPVPGLPVVGMRIFGKSGRLGLLRSEKA